MQMLLNKQAPHAKLPLELGTSIHLARVLCMLHALLTTLNGCQRSIIDHRSSKPSLTIPIIYKDSQATLLESVLVLVPLPEAISSSVIVSDTLLHSETLSTLHR